MEILDGLRNEFAKKKTTHEILRHKSCKNSNVFFYFRKFQILFEYEGDKKLYKVFDAPQDMVKSLTEPLMAKKLTHWKKQYFKNVSTKF